MKTNTMKEVNKMNNKEKNENEKTTQATSLYKCVAVGENATEESI